MEEVEVRLNNFLFNSGVLGFYRIIENVGKLDLIKAEGNSLKIKKEVFENFEKDYIKTMLDKFGKDTRWYTITERKEKIKELDLSKKEDLQILDDYYKFAKKAIESNSYKAGYEIAKDTENPYEYIEKVKNDKNNETMKESLLKLTNYLSKHKEIYCMKDIMYNKINMFWESVAFFNSSKIRNNIEEEYKNAFVSPVLKYLSKVQKSDYDCIECGNSVSKSDASSLSFLKDTGVDINRKKSGFWNFNEDAFICPICNLIYSCVPLGFYIVGKNSIFVNQSNSIEMLKKDNEIIEEHMSMEKQWLEKQEYNLFIKLLNRFENRTNKEIGENEIHNIQVVKRKQVDKDKVVYEFNMVSKEKLKIFNKQKENFEKLVGKYIYKENEAISIYEEALSNFLEGRNQYRLLDFLINETENNLANTQYSRYIVEIQISSMKGDKMEEQEIQELTKRIMGARKRFKNESF